MKLNWVNLLVVICGAAVLGIICGAAHAYGFPTWAAQALIVTGSIVLGANFPFIRFKP